MAFKNLPCPSEAFNPQIVAGMARARELHAVELKPTAITVEGREAGWSSCAGCAGEGPGGAHGAKAITATAEPIIAADIANPVRHILMKSTVDTHRLLYRPAISSLRGKLCLSLR